MIHCIGDSHVNVFGGSDTMLPMWTYVGKDLPGYRSYRLRPRAAYNLSLDIASMGLIETIIKEQVAEKDYVLLCYGEIDCRKHLPKYLDVDFCVTHYLQAVERIRRLHDKLIVWGPHLTMKNSSTKSYGTYAARMFMTERFNSVLKQCCDKEGILFATAHRELLLDNKLPNPEYFAKYTDTDIHLSSAALKIILPIIERAVQCGTSGQK